MAASNDARQRYAKEHEARVALAEQGEYATVISTAIVAAGPQREGESEQDYQARVADKAVELRAGLMSFTNQRNPALIRLAAADVEHNPNTKMFQAVIVGIQMEKPKTEGAAPSNRAIVQMFTRPSDQNSEGKEETRTERMDEPLRGGLLMRQRIKDLLFHLVTVTLEVQTMNNGKKSRVVQHVQDTGIVGEAAMKVIDNTAGLPILRARMEKAGFTG